MREKLYSLIRQYETEIQLTEQKLSLNKISQDEYDFIQFKYPQIVEAYKNILNHINENNHCKALEILESLTISTEEKKCILEIINITDPKTNSRKSITISHELDVIQTLEKYLETNNVGCDMSWENITNYGIKFYESRLEYELNLIKEGFIFKNVTPESISGAINNNISLLYSISNKTSLKDITQDNINDLTRDINYLSHYPLRKIFIDKYKNCNYASTGYHHLSELIPPIPQLEIERYPSTYSEPQTSLAKPTQNLENNYIQNTEQSNENYTQYSKIKDASKDNLIPGNSTKTLSQFFNQIQETLKSELNQFADINKKNIQPHINSIITEISTKLAINHDNNDKKLNHIQSSLNNFIPETSSTITQLISLLNKINLKLENNSNLDVKTISSLDITLESFIKNTRELLTQYLEETIIKQGNNAYEAAQVLEHNIRTLAEDFVKIEDQMKSTNTLMEETKKYLSFKSFKYHINTILWSSTLMVALIGWIFIWVGMQINSGELNQLRLLKYKFANTCKIINSQEPKLKQNLLERLNIDCSILE